MNLLLLPNDIEFVYYITINASSNISITAFSSTINCLFALKIIIVKKIPIFIKNSSYSM